jgi:hypothetical protein
MCGKSAVSQLHEPERGESNFEWHLSALSLAPVMQSVRPLLEDAAQHCVENAASGRHTVSNEYRRFNRF